MPRELLVSLTKKDFRVDTFAAGGPGGQHQNKTQSGVRITHLESGAVGEARDERVQSQNKNLALERLVKHPKFRLWLNRKVWEAERGRTMEQEVDRMMDPKNLRVEGKVDGKWVPIEEAQVS